MNRHVYLFKPEFEERIKQGLKRQTIRPRRKREPVVGDLADLRCWSGAPYRSKQRKITEEIITEVRPIVIQHGGFQLDGSLPTLLFMDNNAAHDFARLDGFKDWFHLVAWFADTHGPNCFPFEGFLTRWQTKPNPSLKP